MYRLEVVLPAQPYYKIYKIKQDFHVNPVKAIVVKASVN
jgi:hypothetical protein